MHSPRFSPLSPRSQHGRMVWLASWVTPVVALMAYLLFWPVPVSPVAWEPPKDARYTGAHTANDRLKGLQRITLGEGQAGPEHIVAHQGWLYTGLSNGEVVRVETSGQNREVVLNTGGRPLGIDVDGQGRLLIADAHKGLLRVTGQGDQAQIEPILTKVSHPVADDAVRYANSIKVAQDGELWLTDASRRFGAQQSGGTFEASVLDILEHSCTGRLIAQNPDSLQARVVLTGLCFPNGIAFSLDGKRLFLSETATFRVLDIDLAKLSQVRTPDGPVGVPTLQQAMQQGAVKVLIDNLPGYPDNLMRGSGERVWLGLAKPRSPIVDAASSFPILRSITLRLPRALWPVPKARGHVIAFDDTGRIIIDLQDPSGGYPETTSVTEAAGKWFVQSLHAHDIGWMPAP